MFSIIFEAVELRRFVLALACCAAQIRRIHGEILASNFHRGSSKLPISAMTFLAVVERAVLLSLSRRKI